MLIIKNPIYSTRLLAAPLWKVHWSETAEIWPWVKITADATVRLLPLLNTFFLNVGHKWLLIPILSNFYQGVQPQLAVILITPTFIKFQVWDLSNLDMLVWTALGAWNLTLECTKNLNWYFCQTLVYLSEHWATILCHHSRPRPSSPGMDRKICLLHYQILL